MESIDLILAACAAFSLYLARKTSELKNLINPFVYFYWIYFVFCFAAIFYRDLYDYSLIISTKTIVLIATGLILFPAGGYLANHRAKKSKAYITIEELIEKSAPEKNINKVIVYTSILLAIVVAIGFIIKSGKIFWLSESFDDERIIARQGIGWISVLGISSAYVSCIYSSIYFFKNKSTIKLVFSTIILAICAISYGNRAPGFEIMLIGGIFFWILKFKKMKTLHALLGFISLLTMIMALGIIRQGIELDFDSLYKQILWRPFANIQNLEWMVSFFPDKHDYLYGLSSIIDISVILPGYQPNFGTYMKELMGKEFTGGSITVSFIGQIYADFGPVVAIFFLFITGYLLQKAFINISNKKDKLSLLILISITAKSMASSGIVSPLIYIFIPCLLIMKSYHLLSTAISVKNKNYKTRKPNDKF